MDEVRGSVLDSLSVAELAMLGCDRSQNERGSIEWYHPQYHLDLRLCIHHSRQHNEALLAQGWHRLFAPEGA